MKAELTKELVETIDRLNLGDKLAYSKALRIIAKHDLGFKKVLINEGWNI